MTGNSRWDLGCLLLKFNKRLEVAGHRLLLVSVPFVSDVYNCHLSLPRMEIPVGVESDMDFTDPEEPRCEADGTNSLSPNKSSSCLRLPCFGYRRPATVGLAWWERIRASQIHIDGRWWARGLRVLMKVREWSEIVAGPRWKTFIRRFNRNRSSGSRPGKFQYDPLSYAMNFDEGSREIGELDDEIDDYSGSRNFSARYASIPLPLKSGATVFGKDVATVAP